MDLDDLVHPDVIADPHSFFAELQRRDPVHWNEDWGGWVLTKYDHVKVGLSDDRLSADRISPHREGLPEEKREEMEPTFDLLSRWMVFMDPPDHTRLRALVNKAFTPRAVESMRPDVEEFTVDLLDEVERETRNEIELIRDFAYHLPVMVIAEMLGVPGEDREVIKDWSEELVLLVFGAIGEEQRHERAQRALMDMSEYLREIIRRRRQSPRDDLITSLIQAREEDESLTEQEIVATATLLLFGGHETTTNLIANGLLALLRNPDQKRLLAENPELADSAVEEILRYEGPSKAMVRFVEEDLNMNGETLREGDRVLLVQSAANRDPDQFDRPHELDLTREPNPHLGFGHGIHYCLGAPLARLEAPIALTRILDRFEDLELAVPPGDLNWQPTIISRGLEELPLSY